MAETGEIIDARDRFRPEGLSYEVRIEVAVTARFLWSVAKCVWQRKNLHITHTFANDPLLGREKQL